MILKHTLLGFLGVGAAGLFALCDVCRAPAGLEAASAPPASGEVARAPTAALDADTATFRVEGMTCGGCAIATRAVLSRLDGVEKAEVSYEKREAVVVYDSDKGSVEAMVAAIRELGYRATVVTDDRAGVGRE